MEFAERMNRFGEGVFSRLAEIKRQKLEAGESVVDLSIGAPNIPPAQHILDVLCKEAADKSNYIYAINDQKDLLQAVSQWYERRYGVNLDPDTEICSLLGSQEGLAHIAMSIVDEGDLVLVPDPCYPVFADGPRLAGAELYYMPQKKENGYVIRLSDIPEEVAQRAKFMVVSYPNNPTAVMAPDSFYEELIAFAKKYDIIVLHDNAYSELVFDGRHCGSFLRFPGAKEVGVEFNSLSKTYGLAGARIGFCVGNPEVVKHLKLLKSNMDYGMFLPLQYAAIAALNGPLDNVKQQCGLYQQRRDALCGGLRGIGWPVNDSHGSMFVWAPIPAGYKNSLDFCMALMEKSGVICTPGSSFGPLGEGYVRFALVMPPEKIAEAVQAIAQSGVLAPNA